MVTKTKHSKSSSRKKAPRKKTPASVAVTPANGSATAASNHDVLRRMYAAMLKCRLMEERVRDDIAMLAYDCTTGREAAAIGASIDLKPDDSIVSSRGNFTVRIAAGEKLKFLLKEAAVNGSSEKQGPLVSYRGGAAGLNSSGSIADPFNLATGVALAQKLEKKNNVVVAFWDGDAGSLEASYEALKFAGIHKLPIIYVTDGGALEELGSRKRSALEEFSFVARDYGFPSILVDGKDVVAVWRAAQESIHRARNGAGATLIECQTEFASFHDPLAHMQHYMTKRGAWNNAWKQQVVDQIEAEIEDAVLA